jgi:UDP-N-acetylmuramate dehydrogenase
MVLHSKDIGGSSVSNHDLLYELYIRLDTAIGGDVYWEKNIGSMTTYRVGGAASVFVSIQRLEDLQILASVFDELSYKGPLLVIGKGSNLLVADGGFKGVAIALSPAFTGLGIPGATYDDIVDWSLDEHNRPWGSRVKVRAGAALVLPVLARKAAGAGLLGAEWCVGVPGSVGGGVRMNAGGHGSDMASMLDGCLLFNLDSAKWEYRSVNDLGMSYRRSNIMPYEVVVTADLWLVGGDPAEGRHHISEIVRWRREHQPGGSNAGSVFVNPDSEPAGSLVERSGLKGMRIGTAQVSTRHANFIQVDDGGSADDVYRLMCYVAESVRKKFGVELRSEVQLAGFPNTIYDGS